VYNRYREGEEMNALTPQIIAEVTNGEYVGKEADRDVPVAGAVRDNRDVKPGNLFVCIRGARADGHSFADDAFEKGAACCLAEQAISEAKGPYVIVGSTLEAIKSLGKYYRSLFEIPVIGITGSVGKTTAKELIAAVLGAKLRVLKTEMNMNNELGVPLTLMELNEWHEAAVIEMGISDFGEMSELAKMVRPTIFVMTNIGYSHIKELGDLNGVLRAKTEALAYMEPDGIAILNGDDNLLRDFDPGMRKITYGLGEHNEIRAENICTEGIEAVEADLVSRTGMFHVKIPAYGTHLASLAPAAAVVGRMLGLTDDEIGRGFLLYTPVEGRSNVTASAGLTLIDDCYNANPGSLKAALKSLSELPGRRVAILGDMLNLGEYSGQMHHDVGKFAADCGIDILICQGEQARFIYDGYTHEGGDLAYYYPLMEELLTKIPAYIKKGDAVLVKASHDMHFEKLLPVISGLGDHHAEDHKKTS